MAAETSPTTGRRYGIAEVCRIWDVPRSSFYADRRRADPTTTPVPAQRRGPKPVVSEDALLAAIRADLARSPWHGEGHRKVWARLRVLDGIRVARKRVLRLMRENALLSPHRARTHDDTLHDRHIITEAPNIMWGTDASVPQQAA
jgi:hypothetical protein